MLYNISICEKLPKAKTRWGYWIYQK